MNKKNYEVKYKKIHKIMGCFDCCFSETKMELDGTYYSVCQNALSPFNNRLRLQEGEIIPDWCPLDDYKEE